MKQQYRGAMTITAVLVIFFTSMAFQVSDGGGRTPPMDTDSAYWTCMTATPIPTEVYLVGTKPPDPLNIYATPQNQYGYTTPVPTETPQFQVERFYLNQLVHIDGMTIKLTGMDKHASDIEGMAIYEWQFVVQNRIQSKLIAPLPLLLAVREVAVAGGNVLTGRWHMDTSAESEADHTYGPNQKRFVSVPISAPDGVVNEVTFIGNWESPLEGGTQLYFIAEPYLKYCGYGSADWNDGAPPPKPTAHIIGLGKMGSSGTGVCSAPAEGTFIRGWGCNQYDTGIWGNGCGGSTPWFHNGWDIANDEGTSVNSPIPGTVKSAGWNTFGLGNTVKITGADGEEHTMGHLEEVYVSGGQTVEAGQLVGAMGNTGNSTGSHVHWTIRKGGAAFDPADWTGCLTNE